MDVIIPVYGNWRLTSQCLSALQKQTLAHRVIVVDDAGPDDTCERLKQDFPDVLSIRLPRNSGFGSACNAGVRAGRGDIVVLVNNDVTADERMLEHLVVAIVASDRTGSATPLLLRPDGLIDAIGLTVDRTLAGFTRLGRRSPAAGTKSKHKLVGPHGAVAAFRREAIESVGLFDESLFMYGEDLDLGLRLAAAGWETCAVTASTGVHLGGATVGNRSKSQRYRAGVSRGYLLRAYGVLVGPNGARALATELIVCVGDLLISRDLAALEGRIAGWRAGRDAAPKPRVEEHVDSSIGFWMSLRMRLSGRGN